MVDYNLIKKLIEIVKKEGISGLAVEENGIKYEVKRETGGAVKEAHHETSASKPSTKSKEDLSSGLSAKALAEAEARREEEEGLLAITSPMVGTFYRSPSPDSDPFVKHGDEVNPGKVVCIVEAMKLFNEIESEISGKIVKILVENTQPVEYGQKLMLVKKN